jgi:hypothetical protein
MLRHRYDRPSAGSRRRAHSAQDRFVIGDVFNHVKRAGEIEDVDARYVTRIHLHKLDFRRQPSSCEGQPGWMQFGAHQPLPAARLGDGGKHRAIAAADFKKRCASAKNLFTRPTMSSLRTTNQKYSASTFESASKFFGSIPLTVSARSGANIAMPSLWATTRPQAEHFQPTGRTRSLSATGSTAPHARHRRLGMAVTFMSDVRQARQPTAGG